MGDPVTDLKITWSTQRVQNQLGNLASLRTKELLSMLGSTMLEQNRKRLDSEKRDPDDKSWEPWSEEYSKHNSGGTQLEKSGRLLDSLAADAGSDAVSVGSNLLYAAVHQYGSPERGIPARPFLGFSDDDLTELGDVIVEFFARETR